MMVVLTVDGMTCSGCARSVEKAVMKVDPTARVSVDLASGHVDVTSDVRVADLVAAIEAAGYDVRT